VELTGQQLINAPRQKVYEALNDPDILRQAIPGCESLEKKSDTEMEATVAIRIGPVKARFNGTVELTNLNPPESYTLVGEGKGGPAGFAKGSADVKLTEEDGKTLLDYAVKTDIGGKIAQLGSRLMDSTAKKLSGEFFSKFGSLVEEETGAAEADSGETAGEAPGAAVSATETAAAPPVTSGLAAKLPWIIGAAIVVLLIYWSLA